MNEKKAGMVNKKRERGERGRKGKIEVKNSLKRQQYKPFEGWG